jgi:FkbM family methyltransferase
VLALEPEPETRALLEHNVRRNGYQNVEIVSAAAGATNGSISLWRSETNFANHALNAGLVPNVRDSVQVDVVTVDDLCAARLGDRMPTVLKIDVEGWEWEVLDGAREVLDRARPTIWLEYWPDGIRANGHDPGEVLDLFDAYGYSVSAHDLVIESPVALTGRELIEYCDRAAERFRAAGRFGLHGILYLHAAQDPSPVPGRPTVEPH